MNGFGEKKCEKMVILNMNHKQEGKQLNGEIIHEIRNPLTAVKGFLQLVQPYLKEIGKEQYAEVAISELNRVNQLIHEYLQGAKPQPHTTDILSLNKVIQDLILLYESETFMKNIQLKTNLSSQTVGLRIPENQLKQVLLNIMNNAIEAIEEKSESNREIRISTCIERTSAVIKISDSGGGIPNEIIDNLFNPYYSSKKDGTGIGLYICKKIIESYEGTIHVESNLGEETTFILYLPISLI